MTNEKRLLERAGLRGIDEIVRGGVNEPEGLVHMLGRAEAVLDAAVFRAEEVLDAEVARAEEVLDAMVVRARESGVE
ncbi:hypothetical protein [Streptomyces sp. NPDC090798]|uniref:hypothetical protein n=1 Tax=Streptomyces sp. NPDC090798 TaxID=3365968 RepID=UPI003822A074